MDPRDILVVLCTVPDFDTGRRIARQVVERGLAACVNLMAGLTSVYRWEGEIHEDPELLMIVKTRRDRFEELRAEIASAHPYSVPEIVALAAADCHGPYAAWLEGQTSPPTGAE